MTTLSGGPMTPLVHAHGALSCGWVLMFIAQTTLVLLRLALDVKREFLVQLVVDAVRPEQRARPQLQIAPREPHHAADGVGHPLLRARFNRQLLPPRSRLTRLDERPPDVNREGDGRYCCGLR